jgi:cellulose/xylan binding protein with CBM9 domain
MKLSLILNVVFSFYVHGQSTVKPYPKNDIITNDPLTIRKCEDFVLTGKGDDKAWSLTPWSPLTKLDQGGDDYESKFKMMFSQTGIYVLFSGQDNKITTREYKDFDNIFDGDVFEVFFHPDPQVKVYFEYEVNQLDKELILMISNIEGHGARPWIPWRYNNTRERSIIKRVDVIGGEKKIDGAIRSWTAEVFFPYGILGLLPDVAPKSGSIWHANFCRLDYDTGNRIKWSWTPSVKESFHELETFRSIKFE